MTLREIHIALRYIDIRTHNKFAMQAALWGAKIPMKHVDQKARNAKLNDPQADQAVEAQLYNKQAGMTHPRFQNRPTPAQVAASKGPK